MVGYGSIFSRTLYYPSILFNIAQSRLTGVRWYDRINDHLILGAIPLQFMTKSLVKENVKGVISLNEDFELKYIYDSNAQWAQRGIETLRLATPDYFSAPSLDQIEKALKFIDEIKRKSGTVYVHCKAGKTRSTTVVVCYLIHSQKMKPEEAYSYVKSIRPQVWLRKTQLDRIEEFHRLRINSSTA